MSGGVDSSVTLHLLKERGFNPIGATMLFNNNIFTPNIRADINTCFSNKSREDIDEIRALTDRFGIQFYEIDLSSEFSSSVLTYFKNEYLNGRTPNPCVVCNRDIKFGVLLKKAEALGINFDYISTGHYAKVEYDKISERYFLKKANDLKKDQSYFLSLLSQDTLKKVIFPLGDFTKDEVRRLGRELRLTSSNKKESQDFYTEDLNELFDIKNSKGDIVNSKGDFFGYHRGIHNYTIGQRRGVNVAAGVPVYVTKIDKSNNKIIIGEDYELLSSKLKVTNFNWVSIPSQEKSFKAEGRVRYRHKETPCLITPIERDSIIVEFEKPERAITPGQLFVAYDGDLVIGAGFIE